jgi:hypothetical protein
LVTLGSSWWVSCPEISKCLTSLETCHSLVLKFDVTQGNKCLPDVDNINSEC